MLKKHNLTPNGYYILYSFSEKLDYSDLPGQAAEITRLKHYGYLFNKTGDQYTHEDEDENNPFEPIKNG